MHRFAAVGPASRRYRLLHGRRSAAWRMRAVARCQRTSAARSSVSALLCSITTSRSYRSLLNSDAHLSKFCSDLQPSSNPGLATPWTYLLHLSLSSVILIDSSTESPVHVLMSIQPVRSLPRLRAPGIVPCIITASEMT